MKVQKYEKPDNYTIEFSSGSVFAGDSQSFPLQNLELFRAMITGENSTTAVLFYGPEASGVRTLVKNMIQEYAATDNMILSANELCQSLLTMLKEHRDDITAEGVDISFQKFIEFLSSKPVLIVDRLGDIYIKTGMQQYITALLRKICERGTRVICIGPTYADSSLEKMILEIAPNHSAIMKAEIIKPATARLFAKKRAESIGISLSDTQISRLVDGLCAYPPLINTALMYCHITSTMQIPINITEITNIFNKRTVKECTA